jgi:ATP-dependent Clp protease ATP-binding subunit ClpA
LDEIDRPPQGRIDKVYVFQPLQGMVIAEIALLKIAKLGFEYGIEVEFVAPELLVQALVVNEKVSRFGIRELERILFDMFADPFTNIRDQGHQAMTCEVNAEGAIEVVPQSTP